LKGAGDTKRYIENIHKANIPGVSLRELRGTLRMNPVPGTTRSTESMGNNKLMATDKELLKEVRFAGFLCAETSAIAIDIFDLLMADFGRAKSLDKVCEIFLTLLEASPSRENFHILCYSIRNFAIQVIYVHLISMTCSKISGC
jgi:hypothetical protein